MNLERECGPLPSGGDLANGNGDRLLLTVEGVLSFEHGMGWGVRIEKPRRSTNGRSRKPAPVLLLCGEDGQTVPDLLRAIAELWDQGDVELTP